MITQNLSTLKIHKLTQEQYDRELAAGRIDENALYLTPDEEIDLTPYATKEEVATKADAGHSHEISDVTDLQSTLDVMEDELRGYTDTKIADLINSAPTTLDTLGEIADAMEENADVVEALHNAVGTKANASDLTAHAGNKENPHEVTAEQLGLGNVENKSSAMIREEITAEDVSNALGFEPADAEAVNAQIEATNEMLPLIVGVNMITTDGTITYSLKDDWTFASLKEQHDAGRIIVLEALPYLYICGYAGNSGMWFENIITSAKYAINGPRHKNCFKLTSDNVLILESIQLLNTVYVPVDTENGKFILSGYTYAEIDQMVTANIPVCLVHRINGEMRTYHFFNRISSGAMYFYWHNGLYFNRMTLSSNGTLSENWWSLVTTQTKINNHSLSASFNLTPEDIGVETPNWNVNDESSAAYIKNRPFYATDPVDVTLLSGTYSFRQTGDALYAAQLGTMSQVVAEGQTLSVTYNGSVHDAVVETATIDSVTYLCAGNVSILNSMFGTSFENTNEPFVLIFANTTSVLYTSAAPSNTNVAINTVTSEIITIPHEYLGLNVYNGAGDYAVVEGFNTTADGQCAHAEGNFTESSGLAAHAEGSSTRATGATAHAEGTGSVASGDYSHAEGNTTQATKAYAHSEGYYTEATGEYGAHAEGYFAVASGGSSHAEGSHTQAKGDHSHAEGFRTIAAGEHQHVEGQYNIEDTESKYIHIAGNGSKDGPVRSNAHTLDWDGNAWFAGDVKVGGSGYDDATDTLASETYVNTALATKADKTMIVTVIADGSGDTINGYTADKTFAEMREHYDSGGGVALKHGNNIYHLAAVASGAFLFSRIYTNLSTIFRITSNNAVYFNTRTNATTDELATKADKTMIVTITGNNTDGFTADKEPLEIYDAFMAGANVYAVYNSTSIVYYPKTISSTGCTFIGNGIIEDNDTGAISTRTVELAVFTGKTATRTLHNSLDEHSPVVANITDDSSSGTGIISDKTSTELYDAYMQGKRVYALYNNEYFNLTQVNSTSMEFVSTYIQNYRDTVYTVLTELVVQMTGYVVKSETNLASETYVDEAVANAMPTVTAADNGKFLRVVDGVWAATTVPRAEDLEV